MNDETMTERKAQFAEERRQIEAGERPDPATFPDKPAPNAAHVAEIFHDRRPVPDKSAGRYLDADELAPPRPPAPDVVPAEALGPLKVAMLRGQGSRAAADAAKAIADADEQTINAQRLALYVRFRLGERDTLDVNSGRITRAGGG